MTKALPAKKAPKGLLLFLLRKNNNKHACAKHVSLGRVVFSRKGCFFKEGYAAFLEGLFFLGRVVVALAKEAQGHDHPKA